MPLSPTTLVCTVGSSLFFPNLNYLNPATSYSKEPLPTQLPETADWQTLTRAGLLADRARLTELLTKIKDAYTAGQYQRLPELFIQLPPDLRLLGAEISSIEAMIRKNLFPARVRLVLLVSDTPEGVAIGKILCSYFSDSRCQVGFDQCQIETVEGLQDREPLKFQREGLTNLVRLLGKHYRQWGQSIAINATGGYKAQIALAVAFGQATGSPVYYKHERFDQIIKFPRIPFTLDLSLVAKQVKLWADLAEPGEIIEQDELKRRLASDPESYEALTPLVEDVDEADSRLVSLSALGLVYWEAYISTHQELALQPKRVEARTGYSFREDHLPNNFKEHVAKFYAAFPEWVSGCHTLPYNHQGGITTRFYTKGKEILGEYQDRANFGARFRVLTAATNNLERQWLVNLFTQWLEREG